MLLLWFFFKPVIPDEYVKLSKENYELTENIWETSTDSYEVTEKRFFTNVKMDSDDADTIAAYYNEKWNVGAVNFF